MKKNPKTSQFENVDNIIKNLLKNPDFKEEYDKLGPEYELISKIIDARIKNKLTQKEIAKRMGTKQSAIARLESGNANPTIQFIQKLATALNTSITLSFHP